MDIARAASWVDRTLRGDDPMRIQYRGGHTDFKMTQAYLTAGRNLGPRIGTPFRPLPPVLVGGADSTVSKRDEATTTPTAPAAAADTPDDDEDWSSDQSTEADDDESARGVNRRVRACADRCRRDADSARGRSTCLRAFPRPTGSPPRARLPRPRGLGSLTTPTCCRTRHVRRSR